MDGEEDDDALPEGFDAEQAATNRRDAKRYLHAAIECVELSNDLADNTADMTCPQAIRFIVQNWMANRCESDILFEELSTLQFAGTSNILTFVSQFSLLVNNITPVIPSQRACEMFGERLPPSVVRV